MIDLDPKESGWSWESNTRRRFGRRAAYPPQVGAHWPGHPGHLDLTRVSGRMVCEQCGLEYSAHPKPTNVPTIVLDCGGRWLKL
ncbi:MAG: hypothetical protein AAFS10_13260 [Myxococcota bacterium]